MKLLTERILQKWEEQGCFVRFLDGNKRNIQVTNLAWVPENVLLANFDQLGNSTDWDAHLSPEEAEKVRDPDWRKWRLEQLKPNKRQRLA